MPVHDLPIEGNPAAGTDQHDFARGYALRLDFDRYAASHHGRRLRQDIEHALNRAPAAQAVIPSRISAARTNLAITRAAISAMVIEI
jgi:hypothetical protein